MLKRKYFGIPIAKSGFGLILVLWFILEIGCIFVQEKVKWGDSLQTPNPNLNYSVQTTDGFIQH